MKDEFVSIDNIKDGDIFYTAREDIIFELIETFYMESCSYYDEQGVKCFSRCGKFFVADQFVWDRIMEECSIVKLGNIYEK